MVRVVRVLRVVRVVRVVRVMRVVFCAVCGEERHCDPLVANVEWPPSLEDHGMGVGSAVVVGGWVELSQQILKKLHDSYVLLFDNFLTSRLCRFVAKSITLAQHWPLDLFNRHKEAYLSRLTDSLPLIVLILCVH